MNQELQEQINLQKENEKWKKLLQSNLFSVCKSMDPDTGLIDCLVSEQVLNKRAAESCQTKDLKYKRNHAVLDIVLRRSFDDFAKLCTALCSTGQSHIVEGFFNPERTLNISSSSSSLGAIDTNVAVDATDAVPDEAATMFDWRDFIKKQLMVLIEVIDPDNGLIKSLAFRKVIPEWVMDRYTSIEGRCSRVEALLIDLMHKGDSDYQKFCVALKETNQQHVVDDYLSHGAVGCYRHGLRRSQTCGDGIASKESLVLCNWKNVLVRQQSKLIDDMDPNPDLINHLEKSGVMNRRCAERCKEIRNEHERTTFILDFMRMRPDRDFSYFCQGLKLTNQGHIEDYFTIDESISTAVQESVSAPATPLGQLEVGGEVAEGGQLEGERPMVRECQPQPAGGGDFCRNLGGGGPRVGTRKEDLVIAVHPAEENTVQPEQELGNINLIEDEDTLAKHQGTENEGDDMGYHSRSDAQHCNEVHLPTAAANPSWEPPSGDQPLARNHVVYRDDSIYGSRPSVIKNVNTCSSSQEFFQEHRETSYPMHKVCRGRCIIFNNQRFIRMRGRTGTEVDSALLRTLFQKLLFKVEEIKDAAAEKIRSKLCAVSQDRTLENDQCLVIFVLSHGDYKNGQCIMYGSDEKAFTLEDVLKPFAPSNCGYMTGKPKLVFIQACRGEQYDYSQSDGPIVNENHQSPQLSYPDFLVGFPTQAGYRAFRDIENGTWYINALTRVFMARAHNTSLNSMMNLIAGVASRWLSQTGNPETDNKTQYAIYTCSFTKDLFFFPGRFE